jgi:6-phosphofructokinase
VHTVCVWWLSCVSPGEERVCVWCHNVMCVALQVIMERSAAGKDYGVVLVPEGLIEFVPGTVVVGARPCFAPRSRMDISCSYVGCCWCMCTEISRLLQEINELLAAGTEASVDVVKVCVRGHVQMRAPADALPAPGP